MNDYDRAAAPRDGGRPHGGARIRGQQPCGSWNRSLRPCSDSNNGQQWRRATTQRNRGTQQEATT
eukprot:11159155-Lingulodinium_polyedra.AAC.1